MPKQRTEKIRLVKQRLLMRLQNGFHRPGDRFLSNRAVAELYKISYQTAHRVIDELCTEGQLERRPQSGTFVPGGVRPIVGVQLVFDARATKAWSFGAKLLEQLIRRLDADRIDWNVAWTTEDVSAPLGDRLPVIWESRTTLAACIVARQSAVLVNDRPPAGMGALFIDSVSTDNFSGGACAAQLLAACGKARRGFAVLSGPTDDARNQGRVAGFQSVLSAAVVPARGWFFDDGYAVAEEAVRRGPAGLFCCNDQLASAVVRWCGERKISPPPLVGFDDAPIAEQLNLTTISIPWDELIDGVARVIRRRLAGDRSTSSQQIFNPRPVIRGEGFASRAAAATW